MIRVKQFEQILWTPWQEQPDVRPEHHPKINPFYRSPQETSFTWIGVYNKDARFFKLDISKNFFIDGQSAPRIAWSFGFLPDGLCRMAALVHDALYRSKGGRLTVIPNGINMGRTIRLWADGEPATLSQKACDQVYRDCYIACASSEERNARIGYRIIRIFGRYYFGKDMPRSTVILS